MSTDQWSADDLMRKMYETLYITTSKSKQTREDYND